MNGSNQNLGLNFSQESVSSSLDTDCVPAKGCKSKFKDYNKNYFSLLRLDIRSLSKNFESFKKLYNLLSFKFRIACFSET